MADDGPLSLRTSFRIGTAGALCSAQSRSAGPNLVGMFDREYWVVCQGSAAPIGRLYALRKGKDDPVARIVRNRGRQLACEAAAPVTLGKLAAVQQRECADPVEGPIHRTYIYARGNIIFIADGRRDHDDVLRLGLRTIVADAPVEGEVKVVGDGGDLATFFRSQAEALDDDGARAEAWRRSHAGCFTEAGEFYDSLAARGPGADAGAEQFVNQAMYESGKGDFDAAEAFFLRASVSVAGADTQTGQWVYNQRARHYLRHALFDTAIELLSSPFVETPSPRPTEPKPIGIEISEVVARDLNRLGQSVADGAAMVDSERLFLLGSAYRMREDFSAARSSYAQAQKRLEAIRESGPESDTGQYASGGQQLTSSARDRHILEMRRALRTNIQNELALIAEAEGNLDAAGKLYPDIIEALDEQLANPAQALVIKLRYADLLARQGKEQAASRLRGEIKAAAEKLPCADPRVKNYFEFLTVQPIAAPTPRTPGILPLLGTGKATSPVTIQNDNND